MTNEIIEKIIKNHPVLSVIDEGVEEHYRGKKLPVFIWIIAGIFLMGIMVMAGV